jgi:hypothetical protein
MPVITAPGATIPRFGLVWKKPDVAKLVTLSLYDETIIVLTAPVSVVSVKNLKSPLLYTFWT